MPKKGSKRESQKSVFPLADQPGSPMADLDRDLMRQLAASGPAMTKKEWKKIQSRHRAFLEAGGAGGVFHSLEVSGLVMAVYAGASGGSADDQANLQRKRFASGFDAKNAYLPHASGCGMIAEDVDFSGANLGHGNYTDAFLSGSCFDGASLVSSDFSRSDLAGASFRDADLSGADFENADLGGADFTGAKLEGARFPGANLQGAKR